MELRPWLMMATVLVSTAWWAQPASALEILSQDEALALTLAGHPRLRAAETQIRAARAREVQAAALPNPNLTLLVDQVPLQNPIGGNYMAGIGQPLLLGGQREARMALAQLETRMAEYDRDLLRQDVATQLKLAYAQVLFAGQSVAQAQAQADQAQAALKALQARYQAGESARVDVLRAEVDASRVLREAATAEGQASQARARLNVLVGRSAQSALALAEPPVAPTHAEPLDALLARAWRDRLELKRAQAAVERETLQRRVVQTNQWTGTEVTGAVGAVGGNLGFSTTLTVPMPLYRQQGELAEAEANRARAEAERDALRNEITLEVEEAYRERATAAGQVQLFAATYIPQAARLVTNAERRYRAGEGSGIEVAEARRAQLETQAEYQQTLLGYRQAMARLERAVGQGVPPSAPPSVKPGLSPADDQP